jgi:hypothetical protein
MGASNSKINNIDIVINLLEHIKDDNISSAKKYRRDIIDNIVNFEQLKEYFKEDFNKLYDIIEIKVQEEPTELNIKMLKELALVGNLEFKNINTYSTHKNVNIIKRQRYKKGEVVRFINKNNKWEYAEILKYNYDYTYDLRNPINLKIINNVIENDLTVDLIELQTYKENDNISFYTDNKYNNGKIVKYNGDGNYDIKIENSDDIINFHETKLKSLEISNMDNKN